MQMRRMQSNMMSSKDMEQFMSREEAKMRKWMCREMFCEQMAVQSERYMNECTGMDRESIEKNIYYRHCYAYFKEGQEKAHAKKEQWYERMIQARSEQEDRAVVDKEHWEVGVSLDYLDGK